MARRIQAAAAATDVSSVLDGLAQRALGIAHAVDLGRERLDRDRARVAVPPERDDLLDVAEAVVFVDEDAVRVCDLLQSEAGVDHARDVDDAGPSGEERAAAGEVVVECVVHEPEDVAAPPTSSISVERLCLVAERGRQRKAQRLDQRRPFRPPRASA